VAARTLAGLAAVVPRVLAGATDPNGIAFVDVDDTIRQTHGYQKQGVAYGYCKVKGLNAQLATLSSPTCNTALRGTTSALRAGVAMDTVAYISGSRARSGLSSVQRSRADDERACATRRRHQPCPTHGRSHDAACQVCQNPSLGDCKSYRCDRLCA